MDYLHSSDLKTILHSKRANIYYLEKCRVLQKAGRVVFLTEAKKENQYWNIPIANTTVILLGIGTSITQSAVRMLASAGVLIGFTGTGGTPLISGNEVEWLSPQSEYRPTEYLQGWVSLWFDEKSRLVAARGFQRARIEFLESVWAKDRDLQDGGFYTDDEDISQALKAFKSKIENSSSASDLLQIEAQLTKSLYKAAAQRISLAAFTRDRNEDQGANLFLNHGNYLAYGLAATALWVLGIPHGLAVMHGKTRRGALVFDVADLIKDALVLPWAFLCARDSMKEREFREHCLQAFVKHKALDFMFDQVKATSLGTLKA